MSTIRKHLNFSGQHVALFMDLAFDKERGVYCREWQVYENPPHVYRSRLELIEFDVRLLPADDLIELAKEIEATIATNQYGFDAINSLRFAML